MPTNLDRIRMCVVDVDGTLLNNQHALDTATREAVIRLRAEGVEIILASSRAPGAMLPVLSALASPTGTMFIASQGAVTAQYRDKSTYTPVAQEQLPLGSALRFSQDAVTAGFSVSWFAGKEWYVSHLDDAVRREIDVVGIKAQVTDLSTLDVSPDKLMVMSLDGRSPLDVLGASVPLDLQAQVSNPTYLEVTRRGVDKARALAEVCRRADIAASEVLAIGDGPNDLTMLRFAGIAAAPANASAIVRAEADRTVPSNDECGVAVLLNAVGDARASASRVSH